MQNKIAVNGTLFSYVEEELHYKRESASLRDVFENYKQYCFEQSVAPLSYEASRSDA